MTADWLDGATRLPSDHNGGSMTGGPPRWVWHTFEADPVRLSAAAGARSLIGSGNEVHFTFNPLTGDIVQILPASVAGRGLVNLPGGVQTNRMGSICLQVEVIAFASHPWTGYLTDRGRAGLARLVAFARAHGIPDVWPAGAPPAFPPGDGNRSASIWTSRAGHYGHSQVPENDHGDPGALDLRVLFPPVTPAGPAPTITPKGSDMLVSIDAPSTKLGLDGKPLLKLNGILHVSIDPTLGGIRMSIPGAAKDLAVDADKRGMVVHCSGDAVLAAYPVDVTPPTH